MRRGVFFLGENWRRSRRGKRVEDILSFGRGKGSRATHTTPSPHSLHPLTSLTLRIRTLLMHTDEPGLVPEPENVLRMRRLRAISERARTNHSNPAGVANESTCVETWGRLKVLWAGGGVRASRVIRRAC